MHGKKKRGFLSCASAFAKDNLSGSEKCSSKLKILAAKCKLDRLKTAIEGPFKRASRRQSLAQPPILHEFSPINVEAFDLFPQGLVQGTAPLPYIRSRFERVN